MALDKKQIDPGCPVGATMKILTGKWKLMILYMLCKGTKRFSELQHGMPQVTQRMLTAQLRELEKDRIILRKVYPVVPPKVEYSLSEIGESLKPVLKHLEEWGAHYLKCVKIG
ncbi:MAG: transcriptional regulator [Gammaproteobacteria bacterium]|jgi:DNA-binding HxlR family transcriptional regulator|nr:transcriptional regulator [Gammaproteobacteria bacterium]